MDNLFVILGAIENPTTPGESQKAAQVEATVAYNLSDPGLSVDWVARHLQMYPDYTSRIFRKAVGKSLLAFIIEQRLFRAKHLLETSTSNISEVSLAVGYENPAYFSDLFRRSYGVAPRQYREEHGRNKICESSSFLSSKDTAGSPDVDLGYRSKPAVGKSGQPQTPSRESIAGT